MSSKELLQWVAEQMPALKARVADTHKLVERARKDGAHDAAGDDAEDQAADEAREALRA